MSSAATTPPSVDKVDGFSRKSVRKAKQKRSQSSSQFRSQGKPIELTPLPLLKVSVRAVTHQADGQLRGHWWASVLQIFVVFSTRRL
ncbi:serine/threonine-protein phosphatase 2A 56 kDa regulatory subunit epsilon isoform [Pimephales promelas]|nr:serine/threonine-protein phosphatase 2A 56 kDa regulatory subunit epsilon isoform [Pimephales promelas]